MSDAANTPLAHAPSTIRLGDLEVRRLGFGAMRLPGKDVWGEPDDVERARSVVRRAVELGVQLIDTSWYYGPEVANRIIAEAIHPYPKDLVIATKLGGKRLPDKSWAPASSPKELVQGCELDLKLLKLDRIDVCHLRAIRSDVPFLESLDALIALKREGKIRHIGLSNVGVAEINQALERTEIVTVQNLYNIAGGGGQLAKMTHAQVEGPDDVLDLCEKKKIAFLPFFPLAIGALGKAHPALDATAQRHKATPAQIAIAWLLARSPVMLPIPGTSSPAHLNENWASRLIKLESNEVTAIAKEARALG